LYYRKILKKEDRETRVQNRLKKRQLKAELKKSSEEINYQVKEVKEDFEQTYSLEDVSIKFNEKELPVRELDEDTYKACRKMSWASNMRRRTYDSLNVLLAAGFLKLNND